jgi:hypothetical protein
MVVAATIALTLLALLFVLFVRSKDIPEPVPISPVQHLDDRKQAIYDNLRDLQFEYRLGKLSDDDYRSTKQALQKELAGVLAETESTLKALNLTAPRPAQQPSKKASVSAAACPHCGATFREALKFCGECGKAMA